MRPDIPEISSFKLLEVKKALYVFDIHGTLPFTDDTTGEKEVLLQKLKEIREAGGEFFFATDSTIDRLPDLEGSLEYLKASSCLTSGFNCNDDKFKSNILFCSPKISGVMSFLTSVQGQIERRGPVETVYVDDNKFNCQMARYLNKGWEVFMKTSQAKALEV
jgi:hypothetical protein